MNGHTFDANGVEYQRTQAQQRAWAAQARRDAALAAARGLMTTGTPAEVVAALVEAVA